MNLVEDIRELFASIGSPSARPIQSLPDDYPAYVIRLQDGYGVAIAADSQLVVSEKFNRCRLKTCTLSIGGENNNYLTLTSAFEEYRYEFATICAEMVYPGPNGEERQKLLSDPYDFWARWKELMGNTDKDKRVYNVIAEMMVLFHKYRNDKSSEWAATRMASHDIECESESCEVKSTTKRYGTSITISGQHQLEHNKPLYLYFCRMEESLEGESINSMMEKMILEGYDSGKIELDIEHQGFDKGESIRDKKYKLLEKRKYEVNDDFPRITTDSFKNNKYPDSITHIEYTIDLEGIGYTEW